eukprot:jgi/Ulvmu1/566/UM001_0574.1
MLTSRSTSVCSGRFPPTLRVQRSRRQIRAMVVKESYDMPIGTTAPDFKLPDPKTGQMVSLADVKGEKGVLVMIISNHCPFVVMLKKEIANVGMEYQQKGVGVVAISSNSVQTHPQDGPELMAQDAELNNYTFPYLYDESQEVAKAYKAMCTPEFYCFDGDLKLVYHGQFDDSRPGSRTPVTGKDVRQAMDAMIAGEPVPKGKPSMGCSVKWHPGQQPAYFG